MLSPCFQHPQCWQFVCSKLPRERKQSKRKITHRTLIKQHSNVLLLGPILLMVVLLARFSPKLNVHNNPMVLCVSCSEATVCVSNAMLHLSAFGYHCTLCHTLQGSTLIVKNTAQVHKHMGVRHMKGNQTCCFSSLLLATASCGSHACAPITRVPKIGWLHMHLLDQSQHCDNIRNTRPMGNNRPGSVSEALHSDGTLQPGSHEETGLQSKQLVLLYGGMCSQVGASVA